MSSGRDYMMENWNNPVEKVEQDLKQSQFEQHRKRMITRMIEQRQILLDDVERLTKAIKEYEDAEKKTI
jgi:secreted Zn-dependent insulinase-like peptidase